MSVETYTCNNASGQCSTAAAVEPEPVKADPRAEYIAGLHALADFLAAHPEVQLPYDAGVDGEFSSRKVAFYLGSREKLAAFARAFPGKLEKRVEDASPSYGFELHGNLCGLYLYAAAHRDEVCTRVPTGTTTVTIPAQAAVPATPERTEEIETFEWRCSPLQAEDREPEAVAV